MTKEIRMTKQQKWLGSGFVIRASFVIRHLKFVIHNHKLHGVKPRAPREDKDSAHLDS
jgi:hypothetical protein